MPRRRFTVTLGPAEAARLRDFDNKRAGHKHWPLGPNRAFLRRGSRPLGRNRPTFLVREWAGAAPSGAMVMTLGKATLHHDDRVDVVVRTKGAWVGWLLVVVGLVCFAVVPRDGFWAGALGTALVLSGWFLYIRRPGARTDLDEVERVLRKKIEGDWSAKD